MKEKQTKFLKEFSKYRQYPKCKLNTSCFIKKQKEKKREGKNCYKNIQHIFIGSKGNTLGLGIGYIFRSHY